MHGSLTPEPGNVVHRPVFWFTPVPGTSEMFLAPLASQPHPPAQPLLNTVVLPESEDNKLLLATVSLQHYTASVNTVARVNAEGTTGNSEAILRQSSASCDQIWAVTGTCSICAIRNRQSHSLTFPTQVELNVQHVGCHD